MTKNRRPYLKPREAAKKAGVTEPTIINWCERYQGLGIKVGGRWRISPAMLQRVLNGSLEKEADET